MPSFTGEVMVPPFYNASFDLQIGELDRPPGVRCAFMRKRQGRPQPPLKVIDRSNHESRVRNHALVRAQLAVKPTIFTTFSFCTMDTSTTLRNSAGPRITISVPCATSAFFTSGSSVVWITTVRSLSVIALGVPLGTKKPCHPL